MPKKKRPLNPFRISRRNPNPGLRPPTDIEWIWARAERQIGIVSERQAHVAGLRPDVVWRSGEYHLRDGRTAVIAKPVCIELDGERWHPQGNARDLAKDERYRAAGYQVVRVWGRDIKRSPEGCVLAALAAVATFKDKDAG